MRYLDPSRKISFSTRFKRRLARWQVNRRVKQITALVLVVVAIYGFVSLSPVAFSLVKKIFSGPAVVFSFIFDSNNVKTSAGRTNILLLGTGGEGHAGKDLSDTVIVLSVDAKQKDAALISIPRDFWVNSLTIKINTAYALGEEKREDGGLPLAKSVVGEIVDLPIHYAVRIDFAGFENLIDLIGGVDLAVERSFDDYYYPIAGKEDDTCGFTTKTETDEQGQTITYLVDQNGQKVPDTTDPYFCRFEHIHFEKGPTHMSGATALKFVRSRMGTNGEGSDFARAARQQKVLSAAKDKIFSVETLTDPKKIISVIATLGKSIDTDITSEEIPSFYKLAQGFDQASLRSLVLDNRGENGLLVNPPISAEYNNQWVLIPKDNDVAKLQSAIHRFIFSPIQN